jgi:hypothetical protein
VLVLGGLCLVRALGAGVGVGRDLTLHMVGVSVPLCDRVRVVSVLWRGRDRRTVVVPGRAATGVVLESDVSRGRGPERGRAQETREGQEGRQHSHTPAHTGIVD